MNSPPRSGWLFIMFEVVFEGRGIVFAPMDSNNPLQRVTVSTASLTPNVSLPSHPDIKTTRVTFTFKSNSNDMLLVHLDFCDYIRMGSTPVRSISINSFQTTFHLESKGSKAIDFFFDQTKMGSNDPNGTFELHFYIGEGKPGKVTIPTQIASGSSSCLVVALAFQSTNWQFQELSWLRDHVFAKSSAGLQLTKLYYQMGGKLTPFITRNRISTSLGRVSIGAIALSVMLFRICVNPFPPKRRVNALLYNALRRTEVRRGII